MIFLDSILPDGTGKDLADFIREGQKKGNYKNLIAISLSGNSPADQKKMYEGYKIAAFLQKPMDREQILSLQNYARPQTNPT